LQLRQVGWDDPTGGVGAGFDAAFVWLPVPGLDRYAWTAVTTEPRLLAMPAGHRLANRSSVDVADVLDEPFLALPSSSGTLRAHWLAAESRGGRPVTIGAEVANTEETVEALTAGLGVCLVAAGNVPLVSREGVVCRPVTGIPPGELILLWRRDDERPLLRAFVDAVRRAS
jgi:DNA-binding transcriptional LysR family regulator